MSLLHSKRVLLIVGGGVAAYKAVDLVRRLHERGAATTVVLTSAGKRFVAPLTFESVSGEKVYDDLFAPTENGRMGHIELSRSADLVLVAPATADLLAKAAHGLANDLASTLLLATDKKPIFAPAMNVRMWLNPATIRNVEQLRADGARFIGPNEGEMACGEFGPGRMSEPLEIVADLEKALTPPQASALAGKRVVVTAGPTREPIDPVRFLSNHSSGKQGYAIAEALARMGAHVTLVSGPVNLPAPEGVALVRAETALEMMDAVEKALPTDCFIGCAAVADWRVETPGQSKTKKTSAGPPSLRLVENPDILANIAQRVHDRPAFVVGFAAETSDLLDNARAKRVRKGCDLIVANDVATGTNTFGGETNAVVLIEEKSEQAWPPLSKSEVGQRLAEIVAERLRSRDR